MPPPLKKYIVCRPYNKHNFDKNRQHHDRFTVYLLNSIYTIAKTFEKSNQKQFQLYIETVYPLEIGLRNICRCNISKRDRQGHSNCIRVDFSKISAIMFSAILRSIQQNVSFGWPRLHACILYTILLLLLHMSVTQTLITSFFTPFEFSYSIYILFWNIIHTSFALW